jgi:uncharacterized protein YjbI with pentapeptide repeats
MNPEPIQTLQPFLADQPTIRNMIFKGGNFRGLDLADLRADGINLEDADLRESCLHEVKRKACNLRDARLDRVEAVNAVLRL